MDYHRPATLAEALSVRARGIRILAGGTDVYPGLRDAPVDFPLLDTTAIPELRHIRAETTHWSIGANATWSDVLKAELPPGFDGLKAAAREVGSIQIQNRATVAGNLCNASPAADGVPPLLTLDAEIEIASAAGARRERLSDFITGNRRTTLGHNEMVIRILVPRDSAEGTSSFLKLGARRYLVISIAMVAARLVIADGHIAQAAIAVGACGPVARRLPMLEKALEGSGVDGLETFAIAPEMLLELSPIDDVRATATYRREAAATLIKRALMAAAP